MTAHQDVVCSQTAVNCKYDYLGCNAKVKCVKFWVKFDIIAHLFTEPCPFKFTLQIDMAINILYKPYYGIALEFHLLLILCFTAKNASSLHTVWILYCYSQTRSSAATLLSFWHVFDKFLISLMASGLKRANQIFRTSVNTWWKTFHVCLSNFKVGSGRDFVRTLTKAYWR